MSRSYSRAFTRALVVPLVGALLALGGPAFAETPAPVPPPAADPVTIATQNAAVAELKAAQDIDDLPPVNPGPDGSVPVDRVPSKALQPIGALPTVDPASGTVPVDRAPVVPNPPVRPVPLTLPQQPAQVLVDATANDALATIGRAGRLNPQGAPDLDANHLQPQVASAQFLDPNRPATVQELIDALASGNIPPPLPVDPLALLQQLPDGLPRLTYRVCSESSTKAVSCSLTLPIGVPNIVDVTGDRTPDVLVDLLPAAGLNDVVGVSREILDLDRQIADVDQRLTALLELLEDPLYVVTHPESVLEALRLGDLLNNLRQTLQSKVEALASLVNLGLAVLQLKLPTSETWGRDLPGHVWAVYDLPGHKRLSVGYDGFRRGSTLPTGTLGIFTFNPLKAIKGVFDVRATLLQGGAGDSLAVTAGLSSVAETDAGEAVDPTVASARFSPVPRFFDAHAVIDPGDDKTNQKGDVDASSDVTTHLDTLVLSNRRTGTAPSDRFTQLKVDTLPTKVSVQLTRTPSLPSLASTATVQYAANSTIDNVLFADYVYAGAPNSQTLSQAVQATAAAVPQTFTGSLTPSDVTTLDYQASSQLAALDAAIYDRSGIVLRGALRQVPTAVKLVADNPNSHVTFTAEQPLGSASIDLSRNFGAYAPVEGDHATLITKDAAFGISAKVSGLRSVDGWFDGHPRLATKFEPGGQAFLGGADVNGVHKARVDITNLPKDLSVDIDPGARKLAYRASDVIRRVHAAYTKTGTGPTVVGAVNDVPKTVDVSYDLGDKPHLVYEASSEIPRVEFFASPSHLENLNPTGDQYLSAAADGIPTKADLLLDLPKRQLKGELADTLDSVNVVARFPVGGRDWLALGELTGVPKQFDADFAEGMFRFRGLSGPLGSAKFTATNHGGATTPTGLHLSAHYTQSTGDLDGSVAVRNLSHVEYSKTATGQTFRLDTDTGGDPVFVDVNMLLRPSGATEGPDDTQLAAVARVDNLPSTLQVDFGDGKLTYRANKNISLAIEARAGKLAALAGLGAPLFPNGVAGVARGCDTGAGCAKDDSAFCTAFSRCLGVVGTVNLPGLPTEVVVDTKAKTVRLTGYRPPSAPLQAYVRLLGLIDDLPDVRALASLSGLPSPLDLTIGPVETKGSAMDFNYTASAPLGELRLDADVTTTNAQFPVLRGRATVAKLPATMHVSGQFGERTLVGVHNSAGVDRIAVTVTGVTQGYLQAAIDGVPATADVDVNLATKHAETTMSAPIGAITALAHVPYEGRTWSVFAQIAGIPGKFDADFGGGTFAFRGLSGPLGSASLAVTNHDRATALAGPHVAVHHREATGDIDASASVEGLRKVEYRKDDKREEQHFALDMAAADIGIDADVVFAAGQVDDVRLAATGKLSTPNTIKIDAADGKITYDADRPTGLLLEVRAGKVAALEGLGAPLFGNGVAARARACDTTKPGCVQDDGPACKLVGKCAGAVAILNLPGLPKNVAVDLGEKSVDLKGIVNPGNELKAFVQVDGVLDKVPHAVGLVTLSGMPSPLNLKVGPYHFVEGTDGKPTTMDVSYEANGPIGNLKAEADATVAGLGKLRGLISLGTIPSRLKVTGEFGSVSTVTVDGPAPIARLLAKVTAEIDGHGPASGLVDVTDVPPNMVFKLSGFDQKDAGVPAFTYNAKTAPDGAQVSTLDGEARVEADLVKALPIGGVDFPLAGNVFAGFTDLGGDTKLFVRPDKSIGLESLPGGTRNLRLGATIHSSFPNQDIDRELFSTDFSNIPLRGTLKGHAGVPEITVDDLLLSIDGIRTLDLVPGQNLSYLTTGLRGDYDKVAVDIGKLKIVPDIDLKFDVTAAGASVFDQSLVLKEPITGIRFHKSDMQMRHSGSFDLGIACLNISTKPGSTARVENHIDVFGRDGQQVLNYLDPVPSPVGVDPKLMATGLDLLTVYYTSPFSDPAPDASYLPTGSC